MNNLIILAIPVKWPDDGAVDFCTLFLQQENATTCFRQECERFIEVGSTMEWNFKLIPQSPNSPVTL